MKTAGVFAMAAAGTALMWAQDTVETVDKRIQAAADTFTEIMSAPDKGIPRNLLEKARCVMIVPGMKKAALGIGGVYGRGFAVCRADNGIWGPPAAIRLMGGSFGSQLGVQSTDLVMLVMNDRGMQRLLSDKFTIGADASAAAGPVGREATAATDASVNAEILAWSRSRGAFAGVSLNGTVVESDKEENAKLYGRPLSAREVIEGKPPVPAAARPLLAALETYAPGRKLPG